jgi:hypothetical protein
VSSLRGTGDTCSIRRSDGRGAPAKRVAGLGQEMYIRELGEPGGGCVRQSGHLQSQQPVVKGDGLQLPSAA